MHAFIPPFPPISPVLRSSVPVPCSKYILCTIGILSSSHPPILPPASLLLPPSSPSPWFRTWASFLKVNNNSPWDSSVHNTRRLRCATSHIHTHPAQHDHLGTRACKTNERLPKIPICNKGWSIACLEAYRRVAGGKMRSPACAAGKHARTIPLTSLHIMYITSSSRLCEHPTSIHHTPPRNQ